MTLFENRFRRSYVQKRSSGEMVVATLLIIAVIAACGVAGKDAEQEAQKVQEYFVDQLRALAINSQPVGRNSIEGSGSH
jgi:hypothetical protein